MNQERLVYPSLQMRFNMYVQKRIYTKLNRRTSRVLVTRHEKYPIEKVFVFPKFCTTTMTNAMIEMTK